MLTKVPIHPPGAPLPVGPYTPAIVAGEFVFVSGQGPLRPGTREIVPGGIRAQTAQVLENISSILTAAGSSMAHVVKVNAHLADMGDFEAYNEVYKQYFPEPFPARTTVQSVLPGPFSVEIDVIAILPKA